MAVQFLMSGCNFTESVGIGAPGVWGALNQMNGVGNAPVGRGSTFALLATGSGGQASSFTLGTGYAGMIAGFAFYFNNYPGTIFAPSLITFRGLSTAIECDVRLNTSGQLFFTRNGTVISGNSAAVMFPGAWYYVEFKALFSQANLGTCEVRVNGAVVLTVTGVTNAANNGASVQYGSLGSTQGFFTDFYLLDTTSGGNETYLGDIIVAEVYPNGAGVNSQWTANVGPFSITSVAAGTGVYSGTITGGASNAYQGYYFVASGFAQSANNGTFACTASSAISITLANASSVSDTTGSVAFQAIVQPGILQTGTRPNNDVTYISDATAGHISDYTHTPYSSTNTSIAAITHLTYARKDDVGIRQIDQVVLLGPTTASQLATLSTSYQYFQQIMDADPNGNPWTIINFNAVTAGVEEVT